MVPKYHIDYDKETTDADVALIELKEPIEFRLETVQDFLMKLGIKPRMHLWEMSIFFH